MVALRSVIVLLEIGPRASLQGMAVQTTVTEECIMWSLKVRFGPQPDAPRHLSRFKMPHLRRLQLPLDRLGPDPGIESPSLRHPVCHSATGVAFFIREASRGCDTSPEELLRLQIQHFDVILAWKVFLLYLLEIQSIGEKLKNKKGFHEKRWKRVARQWP